MSDDVVVLGAGNPLLAPTDVVERVRPWVQKGIRRYQLTEQISYTIFFDIMQGPDGSAAQRVVIYVEVASPILGEQPLGHVAPCPTNLSEERVDDVCRNAIAAVMAMRTERLRLQNGQH